MTKPGVQFAIRRRAFIMIKRALDENGIKFAVPTAHQAQQAVKVVEAAEGEAAAWCRDSLVRAGALQARSAFLDAQICSQGRADKSTRHIKTDVPRDEGRT